jgi:hypothetical protein
VVVQRLLVAHNLSRLVRKKLLSRIHQESKSFILYVSFDVWRVKIAITLLLGVKPSETSQQQVTALAKPWGEQTTPLSPTHPFPTSLPTRPHRSEPHRQFVGASAVVQRQPHYLLNNNDLARNDLLFDHRAITNRACYD